ncbi:MAG: translocation/assembly module TamB [Chloroflexi bacterium]|nr:translocation/assembly module TamB [Chloroflexota bacterium]
MLLKKWQKAILAWLGGILLLCMAFCIFISLSSSLIASLTLSKVNKYLNGNISIGEIKIGLSGLEIKDIRLSQKSMPPTFSLKKLDVEWSPAKMLWKFGILQGINKVDIDSPSISIRRDEKGVINLATLLAKPLPKGKPLKKVPFTGLVSITNTTVSYDQAGKKPLTAGAVFPSISVDFANPDNAVLKAEGYETGRQDTVISVSGNIKPSFKTSGNMSVKNVSLPHLVNPMMPDKVEMKSGSLNADAWLMSDSNGEVIYGGNVKAGKISVTAFGLEPFQNFSLDIDIAPDMLKIKNLSGSHVGGMITGSGRILGFGKPALDLKLSAVSIEPGKISKNFPVTGSIDADIIIFGGMDSPKFAGKISSDLVSWEGRSVSDLLAEFTYADNIVNLKKFHASFGGGEVKGNGLFIRDGDKWRLAGNASGIGSSLSSLFKGSSGVGDFTVSALGEVSSPFFCGDANINRFKWGALDIDKAGAAFSGKGKKADISRFSATRGDGNIKGSGIFLDADKKQFSGLVSVKSFPVDIPGIARGSIGGIFQADGTFKKPELMGILETGKINIAGVDIEKTSGSLDTAGDRDSVRLSFDLSKGGSGKLRALRSNKDGRFILSDFWIADADLDMFDKAIPHIAPVNPSGHGNVYANISGYQDGKLLARGKISSSTGKLEGEVLLKGAGGITGLGLLSLKDMDLEKWVGSRLPEWKIKGSATGDSMIFLGKNIKGESGISVSSGSALGLDVKGVDASWGASDTRIFFAPAYVSLPASTLKIGGDIDWNRENMDLSIKGTGVDFFSMLEKIDLSAWGVDFSNVTKGFDEKFISASIDLNGNVSGPWASPRVAGSGKIIDGVWQGDSLKGYFGFIRDREGKIIFKDMDIINGISRYFLDGWVDPEHNLAMNIKLNIDDGSLSRISTLFPGGNTLNMSGKLDGDLLVTGNIHNPIASGQISVLNGSIMDQQFEEMRATVSSGKSDLLVDEIYARIQHGIIQGQGELKENGSFDFEVSAKSFPLEELNFLDQFFGEVSGEGDLYIKLEGTKKNPNLSMDFLVDNFSLRGYEFDTARGDFDWKNRMLSINDLFLTHASKSSSLTGNIKFPDNSLPSTWEEWKKCDFDLNGKSEGIDIPTMLGLLNHPFKDRISGLSKGDFELKGSLPMPTGHMYVNVDDGKIGNTPLEDAEMNITYGGEGLKADGKIITTSGTINLAANVNEKLEGGADLVADSFDLAIVSEFLKLPSPLNGKLNLMAHASGSVSAPGGYCTFKVNNGSVGKFPFDSFTGYMELKDDAVDINNVTLKRGKHQAVMNGVLPLCDIFETKKSPTPAEACSDTVYEKSMKIDIKYDQDDLSILSFLIPGYQSSEGKISLDAEVTGTLSHVLLSGNFQVKDGQLKIEALNNTLQNIDIYAQFLGDKLFIKNFKGTLGGGQFGVEKGSWIRFKGVVPDEYNMALFGQDLVLDSPKYLVGKLNAALHLDTYPNGKHVLFGTVTPIDATINIPADALGKKNGKETETRAYVTPSWMDQYEANLMLDLKDQIWLKFASSNLLADGYLQLLKQKGDFDLVGKVNVLKGNLSLPFLENSFRITGGSANFSVGSGLYPYLENVSAETEVSEIRVYAVVNGNLGAKNPNAVQLDLTSNPPRTKQQIMGLLLTGIDSASFTSSQTGALFENRAMQSVLGVAEGMVLTPIATALGRTLALTDMNVNITALGGWSVRVAKSMGTNDRLRLVYITYHLPSGDIRNLIGIEYQFPRDVLMRLMQDDSGQYYYWIQTFRRYN